MFVLLPITSTPKQLFLLKCGAFPYSCIIYYSELKQVNFAKNRNNLFNDENLAELTQQSADILEPILQFTSF